MKLWRAGELTQISEHGKIEQQTVGFFMRMPNAAADKKCIKLVPPPLTTLLRTWLADTILTARRRCTERLLWDAVVDVNGAAMALCVWMSLVIAQPFWSSPESIIASLASFTNKPLFGFL